MFQGRVVEESRHSHHSEDGEGSQENLVGKEVRDEIDALRGILFDFFR